MFTFRIRTTWRAMTLLLALGAPACSDDGGDSPGGGDTVTVPKAPSDVKVVPMDSGAHVTWTDNSDNEESFDIMRNGKVINSLTFDSVQYHDPVVTPGETYKYMIHAVNSKGESASKEFVFVAP